MTASIKKNPDQRRFPRIEKDVEIEVVKLTYPPSKSSELCCETRDIGGGGICFVSPKPYDAGTLLQLNILIKGWRHHKKPFSKLMDLTSDAAPLTAIAEVAWQKRRGADEAFDVGVRFQNIDPDDEKAFQNYLKTLQNGKE